MILHVMDENFRYKGRLENYRFLTWKEQYQGKGTLMMIVDDTEQNAAMLKRGRILFRGDRKTAMLIVKISRNSIDNTITAYGYTTLSYLDRLVIQGPYTVKNAESGIYEMFQANNRGLDWITIPETAGTLGELEEEQEIKDKEMLPTFISLCESADVGLKIDYDYKNRTQILKVYQGHDLAYKEGAGGIVFSVEFGNMLSVIIDEDDSLNKNICFVRGVKLDDSEVLIEVGESEPNERREMILNVKKQTKEQSASEYETFMIAEGQKALQDHYDVTNFTAEINPEKLGKAFDLGDMVTCNATRYGVRFDARITEFEEEIEKGFRKVYITMGKPTITYAKAILTQK